MKPEREVNMPSDGTIKFAVSFLSRKILEQCIAVARGTRVLIPIAIRFPVVTSAGSASSLGMLMADSPCMVPHHAIPWERELEHSEGVCTSSAWILPFPCKQADDFTCRTGRQLIFHISHENSLSLFKILLYCYGGIWTYLILVIFDAYSA